MWTEHLVNKFSHGGYELRGWKEVVYLIANLMANAILPYNFLDFANNEVFF